MRVQLSFAYTSLTNLSAWGVTNPKKLRLFRTAKWCSCSAAEVAAEQLLDRYWQARGVSNSEHRRRLIDCATSSKSTADAWKDWDTSAPLPGVNAYWQLDDEASSAPLVRAVSERLLSLHNLLGRRDDIDVVQMVLREPRLLSVSLSTIATRLVVMRGAAGAEIMDIGRVCEAQPSLLLHDNSLDDTPDAWSYGLASDSVYEWNARMVQLNRYREQWGDAHIGFRYSDDPEFVRWARMQRSSYAEGTLTKKRISALHKVGFEFDAEVAEWERWFNQLKLVDPAEPLPLASGDDFLLINWCSVQRIANRAGVLSKSRQALLDSLAFDWTGADALS